jgi:hypothetical protein
MNAQQLHHPSVAREFLYSAEPESFVPLRLTGKALNDDSCWDEFESEYEESLPSSIFSCINDDM